MVPESVWETVRDMQQHNATGRNAATPWDKSDSKRHPATMEDSERYVATPWDQREYERQQATMGDSERHATIPWHWVRQ